MSLKLEGQTKTTHRVKRMKSVRCRGKAQMPRLYHHRAVRPGHLSILLSLNVCISKMKFCTAHRWMRGLNKIKQVKSPVKWQGFRVITQAIPVYSACYWYVDGKRRIEVNGLLEDRIIYSGDPECSAFKLFIYCVSSALSLQSTHFYLSVLK